MPTKTPNITATAMTTSIPHIWLAGGVVRMGGGTGVRLPTYSTVGGGGGD